MGGGSDEWRSVVVTIFFNEMSSKWWAVVVTIFLLFNEMSSKWWAVVVTIFLKCPDDGRW